MIRHRIILLLTGILLCSFVAAQTNKKIEALKSQRGELQEQIKQSESLLLSTNKDVKSQLSDLTLINSRLEERRKFIAAIEKDMAVLDADISQLGKEMKKLQGELKEKQQKYASSVRYLRKNRTIEEKLMFIFSAEDLNQMYRRLRYVTEYANFQRVQGQQIKDKQQQVEAKQKELLVVKSEKDSLLVQREQERVTIEAQEKQQRALVSKLQKRQRNLQAELGCPFMFVVCDVRYRLPDAEQQQHDKDSEHADNHRDRAYRQAHHDWECQGESFTNIKRKSKWRKKKRKCWIRSSCKAGPRTAAMWMYWFARSIWSRL